MSTIDTPTYTLRQGTLPLLISIPHLGTELPAEFAAGMSGTAPVLQDTDWHLDRLYGFASGLGASVLQAKVSRYVIDLNRPPGGESLYPGQTTTGLCPTETFRGEPLYDPAPAPDALQQADRLARFWQPYHGALRAELDRLKAQHGAVLLWDAHSIASVLPRLFEGKLPDLNFGTADGRSCAPAIIDRVVAQARNSRFSQVLNGRFKGGYITRHYGVPAERVHAIQLEMGQDLYMLEDPPFTYLEHKATSVQPLLQKMLTEALEALATLQPAAEVRA
jgi:N-formylglutamate deformylase